MKKTLFIILLLFCSISAFGQKKKKKPTEQPPRAEKIPSTETMERTALEPVQYIAPPSPASPRDVVSVEKPKILEKLNIDSNAEKCACKSTNRIMATDYEEGFTLENSGLKGRVKSIKNIEKRDTLVGFSETLSKSNIVEKQFSEKGFLQFYSHENLDKWNKDQKLKSKLLLSYNTENQIDSIEHYFINMEKPMGSNQFLYNEMGLYVSNVIDYETREIAKKFTFECSKTPTEYFVIKKEIDEKREKEVNELLVFNLKNQLIRKQEIINIKQNTTKNKTKIFVYNESGFLTEENYLDENNAIKSYIHHQYNKQGDIVKTTYKSGDYSVFKYKYDPQNNWIWKEQKEFEGNRYSKEMEIWSRITWDRTILYY